MLITSLSKFPLNALVITSPVSVIATSSWLSFTEAVNPRNGKYSDRMLVAPGVGIPGVLLRYFPVEVTTAGAPVMSSGAAAMRIPPAVRFKN